MDKLIEDKSLPTMLRWFLDQVKHAAKLGEIESNLDGESAKSKRQALCHFRLQLCSANSAKDQNWEQEAAFK